MPEAFGRQNHRIILSCLHVISLPSPIPLKGDEQYCRLCAEFRYVGVCVHSEWAAICETCNWRRRYGEDKYSADKAARGHKHICRIERVGVEP